MSFTKTGDRKDRSAFSLAGRLTLWYAGAAFLLILTVTGYLYWNLKTNLEREDDEFLADYISILRNLFEEHPDDISALMQEVEWE